MINLLCSATCLMKSVTNRIHLLSAFFNIVGSTLIHVNSIINCLTFVHKRCRAVSVWDIFALLLRNIFTFLTKIVYMKNVSHPKNFLPLHQFLRTWVHTLVHKNSCLHSRISSPMYKPSPNLTEFESGNSPSSCHLQNVLELHMLMPEKK